MKPIFRMVRRNILTIVVAMVLLLLVSQFLHTWKEILNPISKTSSKTRNGHDVHNMEFQLKKYNNSKVINQDLARIFFERISIYVAVFGNLNPSKKF